MSVYLGIPGRLLELKCPASQTIPADDVFTFERTLEGKVKAQARSLARRQWDLRVATATPREVGALAAFALGEWGRGPFIWVSTDAPLTNMLTPDQALCHPSTLVTAGVIAGGPINLGADGWAGRSFLNPDPSAVNFFGLQGTPVIPGQKVTASAYVVGAGAQVRIRWYDANDTVLSETTSAAVGIAGAATRASLTATVPGGAALAKVQAVNATQAARPALTWTDTLFEWSDGQGCPKAVLSGLDRRLIRALEDPKYGRYADASFTITEVG